MIDTKVLVKSSINPKKKLDIYIYNVNNKETLVLSIGDKAYEDFTQHKDEIRKMHYIDRHKRRENWNYSGRFNKGFYSYWLLWGPYPDLKKNISYLNRKFTKMQISE